MKRIGSTELMPSMETDLCVTDKSVLGAVESSAGAACSGAVILPELFHHPSERPNIELVDTTRSLLRALQESKTSLADLTWMQLEEIVVEILRGRGMTVVVTPRTRDGGRDLIARGELVPGEPAVLAVEVKHKAVVGIDEVTSRLHRNRNFPYLLFVTTGRFTAGVIREKSKPENFLRLLLKDGVTLNQWI